MGLTGLSVLTSNVFSGGNASGIEKKASFQEDQEPQVKEQFFENGRKAMIYISEDPASSYQWSEDVWGRKDSTGCEGVYDESGFTKQINLANNLAVRTSEGQDFLPASYHYEIERFAFENENGSVKPVFYGPGIAFIGKSNSYSQGEADFNYSRKYSMSKVSNMTSSDFYKRMERLHKACQEAEEGNYVPIKEEVEKEHSKDNYLSVRNVHGRADGSYPVELGLSNTVIDENFLKGFYEEGRVGALAW